MGERRAVAIFSGKAISGVEISSGDVLWEFRWRTSYSINAADPIIRGDTVFISSGYGKGGALIRFEEGNAEAVWTTREMRNHFNSSVLVDGYIYGIDGQASARRPELKCIEFATGQFKWAEELDGTGTLMAAGGKLIVMIETGELLMIRASPERFELLGQAQVITGKSWTVPVLSHGKLYCRNARGDLVCLDLQY